MKKNKKPNSRKKPNPSFAVIISMEVYPFQLMLSVGQNDEELGAELDKYKGLTEDAIRACQYPSKYVKGRAVMLNNNASVIRLRALPKSNNDYGVLAHEIFHIATFVLDRAGMKLKLGASDEAYAYLIGYLTDKIYEAINEYY
jgi:hypothetical protein